MGVELGKVLAKNILAQLEKPEDVKNHDSSVSALCTVGYEHRINNFCADGGPHPLLPEAPQGVNQGDFSSAAPIIENETY